MVTVRIRSGHRLAAHTADLIVEAWGPRRASCLEQAVLGLVDAFIDRGDVVGENVISVGIPGATDVEILVSLLEEAIYTVEVAAQVPVDVALHDRNDGGVEGGFRVVPLSSVEVIGSVPKGVSRNALSIGPGAEGWTCQVTVDV